jgi:hypothetical protein
MSSYNYPVFGTVFGRGGDRNPNGLTGTSGIALNRREVDTSVDRKLFTENGTQSGHLSWEYTRQIDGIQTSVSTVRAADALGPSQTFSERKVFFVESDRTKSTGFADWTIFDVNGVAVGAATGTTDTDGRPSATFNGRSGESV